MSRHVIYPFYGLLVFIFLLFGFYLAIQMVNLRAQNPAPINWENSVNSVNVPVEKSPIIKKDELNIYYFGYGSNLNLSTMQQRCGAANLLDLGQASLPDYRMYFYGRGHANIKPDQTFQVEGVLYKINDFCLASLDRDEGYPIIYDRRQVNVIYQNQPIKAQVYIVLNDDTIGLPTDSYYQIVITGAEEHNLPAEYLDYIKQIAGRS